MIGFYLWFCMPVIKVILRKNITRILYISIYINTYKISNVKVFYYLTFLNFFFYLWKSEIFMEFYQYLRKFLEFYFLLQILSFSKNIVSLINFLLLMQNVNNRLAINMAYSHYVHSRIFYELIKTIRMIAENNIQQKRATLLWYYIVVNFSYRFRGSNSI